MSNSYKISEEYCKVTNLRTVHISKFAVAGVDN